MSIPRLASLLLLTTALATPSLALAQESIPEPGSEQEANLDQNSEDQTLDAEQGSESPEISIPGGAIVVTGRRNRNVQRTAPQVVSVLSTEEIARTGEGDIAGALNRVTGLSVVGSGYVFVRGLGDRYSLALLNGSPLPSPEPLKRVVPLDLFPTSIVASSLVQKSYSANFPGEFGGGVINLTTKAIPSETYIKVSGGAEWDSETTNKLGYTYYGSKTDWTGYDNGNRDLPVEIRDYFRSGTVLSDGTSDLAKSIGGQLINGRNAVLQRNDHLPANFSGSLTGGTSFEVGAGDLGIVATAGYSNKWQTRDAIQQRTLTLDAEQPDRDFRSVTTNNRIVANGLLGIGYKWDSNTIRWTNLYIHDTIKRGALRRGNQDGNTTIEYMYQDTAWYERQLFESQLVGEIKLDADTELNVRGAYAKSKRDAPYEIGLLYSRTHSGAFGDLFVNTLDGGQLGDATVAFSKLDEDVWSASADLSHTFSPGWTGTIGYAYQLNDRRSSRRAFQLRASGTPFLTNSFGTLRPDVLFQPGTFYLQEVAGVNYTIEVTETDTSGAVFDARLNNHAWYAKLAGQLTDALSFDLGVRWEYADQSTKVVPVSTQATSIPDTRIKKEYWLPALTLTYEIQPGMQVRLNASKTIARPQFRELLFQTFYDPDGNRTYTGNPFLTDSEIYNAEGRFEWYMGRDERLSVGAFFKRLDNPIETFLTGNNVLITSFANAPKADLYGAEIEVQKHFEAFADRQILVAANYTYTKSKLKVSDTDTVAVFGASGTGLASSYFRHGAPLTGQSEHIANVQIGLEQEGGLSQQTFLFNYASKRVVSRGLNGSTPQPDIFENPGLTIDFVARQGIKLFGLDTEWKFEARNLTGRGHKEYQKFENGTLQINSYDLGRTFALAASVQF